MNSGELMLVFYGGAAVAFICFAIGFLWSFENRVKLMRLLNKSKKWGVLFVTTSGKSVSPQLISFANNDLVSGKKDDEMTFLNEGGRTYSWGGIPFAVASHNKASTLDLEAEISPNKPTPRELSSYSKLMLMRGMLAGLAKVNKLEMLGIVAAIASVAAAVFGYLSWSNLSEISAKIAPAAVKAAATVAATAPVV